MAACYLLTIYAAARSAAGPGRRGWAVAAVAACAAGVWCKESIATAPLVVALYDRIFLFESWREAARARRWLYAGLALSWVLTSARAIVGLRSPAEARELASYVSTTDTLERSDGK